MKSDSDSAQPPRKWRLRRTLKRTIYYRPIEDEDVKYAWAAYKHAAFDWLKSGLSPEEFKTEFQTFIVSKCHAAWTLSAGTKKGIIPVGLVLAAWGPGNSCLMVLNISWMPWASKRNIIECTVGFFNAARHDFGFMGAALPEHRKAYEACMKHGIMRRIGTSEILIGGKHCQLFETIIPRDRKAA
jgi:hypothetical protein